MRILQTDEDWQEPEKQTSLQFDNPKYIISMHDIIIDNIVTGVFFVRDGVTKKNCCSFGFCPNYLCISSGGPIRVTFGG